MYPALHAPVNFYPGDHSERDVNGGGGVPQVAARTGRDSWGSAYALAVALPQRNRREASCGETAGATEIENAGVDLKQYAQKRADGERKKKRNDVLHTLPSTLSRSTLMKLPSSSKCRFDS